jgi:hypothetical protein
VTDHHFPLIADMMTDFILYPSSEELWQLPDEPLLLAKDRGAVTLYFNLLQAILVKHGHAISLDHIEHYPAVGWLIRYRASDPMTITMLHDIAAGDAGPSDPAQLGFLIGQVHTESLSV